jgi:hypothetical protein
VAGGRRQRGGICGLLDLIEEHRGAIEYDWRTRFGQGLDASVPDDIGWGEAIRLVRILRSDPSSQLAASLEGWDYPLDRAGWMLADLIDVQGSSKAGKKWKSYQRPAKAKDKTQRWGDAGGRTRAQVVQILNGLGHDLPV